MSFDPLAELQAGTLFAVFLAYLIGSIPFGVVTARVMNLGDLTKIGSGNVGATNVLRTGNKAAAALTLLLDAGKGAAAVGIGFQAGEDTAALLCALASFLGHLYPVWLRFRGGKGVATYLGILIAYSLPAGVAACAAWFLVAVVFRYSSLASLASAAAAVGLLWQFSPQEAIPYGALISALVFWRHRANIRRLFNGTESTIKLGWPHG